MFYIPVAAVRLAQKYLSNQGYDPGPVDGDLGPKTEAGLDRMLDDRAGDLHASHRKAIVNGSRKRKLAAYIQLLAHDEDIEAGPTDGLWGSQTNHAFEELKHLDDHGQRAPKWRDSIDVPNPNGWPVEERGALEDFYGPPGDSNLVMVDLPYPHRLSWKKSTVVHRTRCHERVADSIHTVLSNVKDHYGLGTIKDLGLDLFGGCYNYRKKRGGSTMSTHAWGIALDYDPERNPLRAGRDQAEFAKPAYDEWWGFWEEEGWISLGRHRNYDWMHVQAARLP